jgi:hypothetical protein
MIRPAQSDAKLRELLANGGLPASACGRTFVALIGPLLAGDVVAWQKSGAGRRLVVNDPVALNDFCRQQFPEAVPSAEVRNRVAGVGRFRDTKAMASNESEIICVRAWHDEALLKYGKPVGAATATAKHGLFSFLLTPGSPYELRGPCALVENPAIFAAAEHLNLNVDLMIYGHGRISRRVVEWLCHSNNVGFSLVHLPDYDPVGLSEFQRLQSGLGKRVLLHIPADLEARFSKFSNRKLLEKTNNQALLAKLRHSDEPEIHRVVELIDRYNAGLEQEALLINLTQL